MVSLSKQTVEKLNAITGDNESGAHAITFAACDFLINVVEEFPDDTSRTELLEYLARTGRQLVKSQPHIAPLRKVIKSLLRYIEVSSRSVDIRSKLLTSIRGYESWLREVKDRIGKNAAPLISSKTRILTHSSSTLVIEALREAMKVSRDFEVIATEARPVYEGRLLTQTLRSLDIPVTLIVDAAAPGYCDKVDLVLLGADRVTQSEFINRVGSLSIVLSAREHGVPCYVLSGSDKYLSENEEPVFLGGGGQSEMWSEVPSGVTVSEEYFERVPLRYVTGLVSETGIIPYGQFARQAGPFFKQAIVFK